MKRVQSDELDEFFRNLDLEADKQKGAKARRDFENLANNIEELAKEPAQGYNTDDEENIEDNFDVVEFLENLMAEKDADNTSIEIAGDVGERDAAPEFEDAIDI